MRGGGYIVEKALNISGIEGDEYKRNYALKIK